LTPGLSGSSAAGAVEGLAGGGDIAQPMQQVAAVQVIFADIGCDREGPVDRHQCRIEPIEHHLDRGEHAQHSGIARVAPHRLAQQLGGTLDPAAAQQQLGRVHRRAAVVGQHLDSAERQRNGAVDLADHRQRAAGVTVAFGPIRRQGDQAFIGSDRFAMTIAVAEQPGAKLRRIGVLRGRRKGASAAFDRLVAPAAVKQRLGSAAIQRSVVGAAAPFTSQMIEASIESPGTQRRREGFGIDQGWGEFSIVIQLPRVFWCSR
jgi:hypothetical protein